jgi:type VI protein secretion system component Hcp
MKTYIIILAGLLLASPMYGWAQTELRVMTSDGTGSVRAEGDLQTNEQNNTSDSSADASMQNVDASGSATTGIEHDDIGVKADDGIVKELDKSSPKLMEANADGKVRELDKSSTKLMEANADGTAGESTTSVVQYTESDFEFIRADAGVGGDAQMNKADLIAELETQRAVYIKIGDIKGESGDKGGGNGEVIIVGSATEEDAKSGGQGEIIIVGGAPEEASKPKEIVVVGSKVREVLRAQGVTKVTVRGWDPEKKEEISGSDVQNEADLGMMLVAVAQADENIEEVSLNFEEIKVTYTSQGKLFGFIPVSYLINVTADRNEEIDSSAYGRVKVKFPWYRVLMRTGLSRSEIEAEITEGLTAGGEESDVVVQAKTFITISNILKAHHDTAMSSIRNMRV